jgi:carnitine O-acetyltransferase
LPFCAVLHLSQQELFRLDGESPTSWLEGFWDTMYLEIRDPLIINVSPFLELVADPKRTEPTVRAAAVIHSSLQFLRKVETTTLEPDFERDTPLDMSQYLSLFRTVRLPAPGRDQCVTFDDSRHVVIICNHNYYAMTVLNDAGEPLSEGEILSALNAIVDDSAKGDPATDVGLLTTESRQRWFELRQELEKDETNKVQRSGEETRGA